MLGMNAVVPSIAHAGFTPEELAAFEITEMRATVTTALPEEKVIEVIDPHGHKEILTVGIDLTPLNLQPGDNIELSILDGLVVEMEPSTSTELSFNREDIILPMDMGRLKQGMRVALASGTAKVISIDHNDNVIDLLGPLGGINNLDVLGDRGVDPFERIAVGEIVNFRLIQPLAVGVRKLPASTPPSALQAYRVSGEPLIISPLTREDATLKSELVEAFELAQIKVTIQRLVPGERVVEVKGAQGHTTLLTTAVDPTEAGLKVGDVVSIELLQGLVVDLRPSKQSQPMLQREDHRLAQAFGPVDAGARVSVVTGTAEVVKVSEKDQELSLRGPFGGVHNLDVRSDINGDPLQTLKVGDYVEFRGIKPIAIAVRALN